MAKQRKSLEEIEKIMTGGEPKFTAEVVSETDMSQALNWYSQNRDTKQAIKYINDYLKKNKIKVAADIVNRQVPTYGFICRMKINGAVLSEKYETKFQEFIGDMKAAVSKPVVEKVEEKKTVVSIQDRVLERTREIAGEVEGSIDDYILSDFKKAPSPYGIMHSLVFTIYHFCKNLAIDIFNMNVGNSFRIFFYCSDWISPANDPVADIKAHSNKALIHKVHEGASFIGCFDIGSCMLMKRGFDPVTLS